MCGIAGIVGNADADRIRLMTQMLVHRGPDDGAVWAAPDGSAAFGHRRLSIIDLSPAGRQPMRSGDGRYTLVFNGEIFNFQQLRTELERAGAAFRTKTDSEVLLQAFIHWGTDVVHHVSGQFAFAVWDSDTRSLFAARDHLGIKPLYYALESGALYLASEPKAIRAVLPATRAVNWTALPDYLAFLWVPGANTLFTGISKLEPGCCLHFHGGVLRTERWWDPIRVASNAQPAAGDARERAAAFRGLFEDAVREQLVSDVPLGLLLSGGLDSTALLSAMRSAGARVHAFTATYPAEQRAADVYEDDLVFARRAARHYGAELREERLTIDVADALPRALRHLDEPLADPTVLTNLELTRIAKSSMTVVLTGMGADEILAGYTRYPAVLLGERLQAVPPAIFRASRRLLEWLVRGGVVPLEHARRPLFLLEHLGQDATARFLGYSSYVHADRQAALLEPDAILRTGPPDPYRVHRAILDGTRGMRPLTRMLLCDLLTYLPCLNLENMDKTGMAHAVEMRVPFLDRRLVEFALTLPDGDLIDGRTQKVVLRRAYRGDIPEEILARRKTGYNPPVRSWVRVGLRERIEDTLRSRAFAERGMFRSGAVERLLDENRRGIADHAMKIWMLFVFETWMRTLIDAPGPTPGRDPSALPLID